MSRSILHTLVALSVLCGTALAQEVKPGVSLFGTGCAGASGLEPTIGVGGFPVTGQAFTVDVRGPASSAGLLAVGASKTSFAGLALPFDLSFLLDTGCSLNTSLDLSIAFATGDNGDGTGDFALSASIANPGLTAFAQAFVLDVGSAPVSGGQTLGGLTRGLQVTSLAPSPNQGGEVIVNEFLADPTFVTDERGEYIEVLNTTAAPIDVEGWFLRDLDFDGALIKNGGNGVIVPAGGTAVLAVNGDRAVNGNVIAAAELATYFLANTVDEIILVDDFGKEIDRIEYDVAAGWPLLPGRSTELDVLFADGASNDLAASWAAATCTIAGGTGGQCNPDLGTPGTANDQCLTLPCAEPQLGAVIFSEFQKNPAGIGDGDGEYVEVFNTTAAPIDIDGWTLADDGSDSHVIANGGPLVVAPGGRLVLGSNADPQVNGGIAVDYDYSGFVLGNGVDELVLRDLGGALQDRVVYDDVTFPQPDTGFAAGLDPALAQDPLVNDLGANWCNQVTIYAPGNLGTPGAPNDPCP